MAFLYSLERDAQRSTEYGTFLESEINWNGSNVKGHIVILREFLALCSQSSFLSPLNMKEYAQNVCSRHHLAGSEPHLSQVNLRGYFTPWFHPWIIKLKKNENTAIYIKEKTNQWIGQRKFYLKTINIEEIFFKCYNLTIYFISRLKKHMTLFSFFTQKVTLWLQDLAKGKIKL